MLDRAELNGLEGALFDALGSGQTVGLPLPTEPRLGATWPEAHRVRSEVLRQLLVLDGRAKAGEARAIRLHGARITGGLNLEDDHLHCPLILVGCYIEEFINLSRARGSMVDLEACHCHGLAAHQMDLSGDLRIVDTTSSGPLITVGASIDGYLMLAGSEINNIDGVAMMGDSMTIGGGLHAQGLRMSGECRIAGSRIGGNLNLSGASFSNLQGVAFTAAGSMVVKSIAANGLSSVGSFDLTGAHVGLTLEMIQAHLTHDGGAALQGTSLTVDGEVLLERAEVVGGVMLYGAHIAGHLSLGGATIKHPVADAVAADGLQLDGALFARDGFTAVGAMRFHGCHIRGPVSMTHSRISNPGDGALWFDSATLENNVVCDFTRFDGETRFLGAHIAGQMSFHGSTLNNPLRYAFSGDGLTVAGNVQFTDGFRSFGMMRLPTAHIGGQLAFSDAHLSNPGGTALSCEGATLSRGLAFDGGSEAEGEVSIRGVDVHGGVSLSRVTIRNARGTALDFSGSEADWLFLGIDDSVGVVDLTSARATRVAAYPEVWPTESILRGLRYETLDPELEASVRLGWLNRVESDYKPQVYDQLIATYRRSGRVQDARRVVIAKQRRRRREVKLPERVLSLVLDGTVGFGQRTWLAGVWLLTLLVVDWFVFHVAHVHHDIVPKSTLDGSQPHFQAVVYALDALLPVIKFGQVDSFVTIGVARWFVWGSIVAGWILATALAAAVAGLLQGSDPTNVS